MPAGVVLLSEVAAHLPVLEVTATSAVSAAG
jgi:hypothetical protein